MAVEPIVNRTKSLMSNQIDIVKINVSEEKHHNLASDMKIEVTPTFVFLDKNRKEQWRTKGYLNPWQIQETLLNK
tara:strand:- start:264 stop:488 length:225 start_codon:yes stop_codon:yes gene_type:complete